MGLWRDVFGRLPSHDERPDTYNIKNYKRDEPNYDSVLAVMGYAKIEENELMAKYLKVEPYGHKTVEVYLSDDKVALLKCYDQLTGGAMALTAAEINIFYMKLQQKVRNDWTDIVIGS